MPQGDWLIPIIAGGVLLFLGIIGILWGIFEEKQIFDSLSRKHDLREFALNHFESPQPGALKIGGWISLILGLILLILGIVLWRI
jgi:hypothetical protein